MDKKAIIAAKLAEWDLKLTDAELDQLVAPYENLLRWQGIVEGMLKSRTLSTMSCSAIGTVQQTVSPGRSQPSIGKSPTSAQSVPHVFKSSPNDNAAWDSGLTACSASGWLRSRRKEFSILGMLE